VEHYTPLSYEVRKLHKVSTKLVPLVVGSLGVVTMHLEENLRMLDIPHVQESMQISAVLGTAIISGQQ